MGHVHAIQDSSSNDHFQEGLWSKNENEIIEQQENNPSNQLLKRPG